MVFSIFTDMCNHFYSPMNFLVVGLKQRVSSVTYKDFILKNTKPVFECLHNIKYGEHHPCLK